MKSEELAVLREQRDVLLQSLRDLETERAAGEIGDDDYASLKDDYTSRAASVLKAIEAGEAGGSSARRTSARRTGNRPSRRPSGRPAGARPAAAGARSRPRARPAANPPVGRRQRTLAVSLVVGFAIAAVAGLSVVLLADGRDPGQPVTGSGPDATEPAPAATDRVDQALSLETEGRAVDALMLYDEILVDDPDNVEALAYRGWLLKRAGLADQALESLDRAVAVDPTFADAHFFRGMVLYQDRDDPAGAVAEFQAFLDNDPPPEFVAGVLEVKAKAEAAVAARAGATTTIAP